MSHNYVLYVRIFPKNPNKLLFVCVTNSGNIILFFHKKIMSHEALQKFYSNLTKTCKNKCYETINNKIKNMSRIQLVTTKLSDKTSMAS